MTSKMQLTVFWVKAVRTVFRGGGEKTFSTAATEAQQLFIKLNQQPI